MSEDIPKRLKKTDKTGLILAKDFEFFLQLIGIDNESACVRARRVVERMCRRFYSCKLDREPGTKMLGQLLGELKGVFPKKIIGQIMMIQEYGNLGAHGSEETFLMSENLSEEPVSEEDIELLRDSLSIILNYYLDTYKELLAEMPDVTAPLEVLPGSEFKDDDIEKLFVLARAVYGEDIVSSDAGFVKRHNSNPDIYQAIFDRDNNICVGFLSILPLTKDAFDRTLDFGDDADISEKDIRTFDIPDFYYLHLASVVVDPSYRDHSMAYKRLFDSYVKFLAKLAERDLFISELSADAITTHGNRICMSLGMSPVKKRGESSTIYHSTLLPPALRVGSEAGTRLIRFYKKKYEEYKDFLEAAHTE